MSVMMVRFKVEEAEVSAVEAAVTRMVTAIQQERPNGVRYAFSKLPDGVTFVALLELDEGVENPLPSIEACREYQEKLGSWVVQPPVPVQLEVVGSYRLFEGPAS